MARVMDGAEYTALQNQPDALAANSFEVDDEATLCEFEPESSDTERTPSATVTPSQTIAKNVSSLPAITPPVSNFEAKAYTCSNCHEARKDRQYQARVANLLRPIHCSVCNKTRAAIFFSYEQRYKPSPECIRHEAHRKVCPHVSIDTWHILKKDNQGKSYVCREAECLEVEIEFHLRDQQAHFSCKAALCQNQEPRYPSKQTKQNVQTPLAARLLRQAYDANPSMFCPHIRAIQDPFRKARTKIPKVIDRSKDHSAEMTVSFCKSGCWAALRCFDVLQASTETYYCSLFTTSEAGEPHEQSWHAGFDPESFGLFDDQEAKNVAWCGDLKCSTSFALVRFDAFKFVALAEDQRQRPFSMTLARRYWKEIDKQSLRLFNKYI